MPDIEADWHHLQFDIRRSVRYHNRRRAFFDRVDKLANLLAIVFGSAAVFGVLERDYQSLALCAAALITITSALNLVVGSSLRARDHADFARRFIALEKALITQDATPAALRQLTAERLMIEAEEPPVLRVLDCLCHNEEMRAQGYPAERLAKITWWQALFAQVADVGEDRIHASPAA